MLIIRNGKYKNKRLKEVDDPNITRPSKDILKIGLINIINYHLLNYAFNKVKDNLTALDLFSGTGQIGIELLSKDVFNYVVFNDEDNKAYSVIKENLKTLNDKDYVDAHALTFNLNDKHFFIEIKNYNEILPFNLIFLDPPYKMVIDYEYLENLLLLNIASKDTLFLLESDKNLDDSIIKHSESGELYFKEYKYGRSKIYLIKFKNS